MADGGWFVGPRSSSNIVHEIGCPTFKREVRELERLVDAGCSHNYGYWELRLPTAVQADQITSGIRCRVCAPEVNLPARRRKMAWEKSGTGWPESPHQSLTEKLGPRASLPPIRGAAW
ncbi:hypothetical protein [Frankia sp. AgW1.1]|uniref:hypothetical protein n=1 Tax=Frankia sp. AgW1.1 TaxID=1836971 RepID=UPI00193392CA|nr:hypothetical protein [Frankia sp. AgW1.1]